ncbi:hypothetical protein PRZ48_002165 [Zasmidium cellare]|uniref:Uncharacterized protein n=1 Tax=Zasmidium cellare TaxID=395010 RepID=A0ABR0F3H7_ZASCE|nr:hypothetical protein PRZ48_002165 [Zasmidium cellare]
MASITAGKALIVLANLFYSIGAFVFDFNETHVRNPRWPPHARFHNGQTMTLGLLLSATSIYYLLKPVASQAQAKDNLFTSALIGSFYCSAGMSAILYPGTAWQDPEFAQGGEQRFVFSGTVVAVWIGYLLEVRRMGKVKSS